MLPKHKLLLREILDINDDLDFFSALDHIAPYVRRDLLLDLIVNTYDSDEEYTEAVKTLSVIENNALDKDRSYPVETKNACIVLLYLAFESFYTREDISIVKEMVQQIIDLS